MTTKTILDIAETLAAANDGDNVTVNGVTWTVFHKRPGFVHVETGAMTVDDSYRVCEPKSAGSPAKVAASLARIFRRRTSAGFVHLTA
jgi:hypothetical protein